MTLVEFGNYELKKLRHILKAGLPQERIFELSFLPWEYLLIKKLEMWFSCSNSALEKETFL